MRVLLLARNLRANQQITDSLYRTGVNKVVWATDPVRLNIDENLSHFDVIVVSDTYCSNGRDTARLVRSIRKIFAGPMIAFVEFATNEGPFACQVAGCNFVVERSQDTAEALCTLIPKICEELAREHQKEPA
jgi:AmiR/NasT family two-component response regulator